MAKYGMARHFIPRLTDAMLDILLVERHDTSATSTLCLFDLRAAVDVLKSTVEILSRQEFVMETLRYFSSQPVESLVFQRYMEDAHAALLKNCPHPTPAALAEGLKCVLLCAMTGWGWVWGLVCLGSGLELGVDVIAGL